MSEIAIAGLITVSFLATALGIFSMVMYFISERKGK